MTFSNHPARSGDQWHNSDVAAAEHLPPCGHAVLLKSGFLVDAHHLDCRLQADALHAAEVFQGVLPEATADPLTVGVGVDLDVAHSWSEILFMSHPNHDVKVGWRERFDPQHQHSGGVRRPEESNPHWSVIPAMVMADGRS